MSDDGAGVHAIRRLTHEPRLPAAVQLVDGGTLGLELLSVASGADLLIVIDAVDLGAAPGTPVRLDGGRLAELEGGGSAHQLGLPDLLCALRLLGAEPARTVLLGVQPAFVGLGPDLSPEVERGLETICEWLLAEVGAT